MGTGKGCDMKNVARRALTMAACAVLLVSCGDDNNDPAPAEINGPAILRVSNETRFVQEVTFDGSYIGDVAGETSRDWQVPAGIHTVNIHDTDAERYTMTGEFYAGVVTQVRFGLPAPGGSSD